MLQRHSHLTKWVAAVVSACETYLLLNTFSSVFLKHVQVYAWNSQQEEIYETTARPIVDAVLSGYNGMGLYQKLHREACWSITAIADGILLSPNRHSVCIWSNWMWKDPYNGGVGTSAWGAGNHPAGLWAHIHRNIQRHVLRPETILEFTLVHSRLNLWNQHPCRWVSRWPEDIGLNIFWRFSSFLGGNLECLVRASYLEIYNEDIRDLLSKNSQQKLELKETADKGVYVKGLMQFVVKGVSEINSVLQVSKNWSTLTRSDKESAQNPKFCLEKSQNNQAPS